MEVYWIRPMGIETLLNILCWTPLAKPIRAIRLIKINRVARENYDLKKIDRLINQIMMQHGDLLS
jgi:hypothetical protein